MEMATEVRLFLGGLAADVSAQELRDRFERVAKASNCAVTDVELPPNRLTPGATRGFAYLSLSGEKAATVAAELCKAYHRTKWRGGVLRVELATPDFQERWQREADAKMAVLAAGMVKAAAERRRMETPPAEEPEVWTGVAFEGKKRTRFESVREEVEEQWKAPDAALDIQESSSTDSESDSLDEDPDEDPESSSSGSQSEEEDEEEEEEGEEEEKEEPVRMKQAVAAPPPPPSADALADANARRLAALQEKQKKQQQAAAESRGFLGKIDAVGGAAGKKTTFDEDGEVDEVEDRRVGGAEGSGAEDQRVVGWLDSDDEDDEDRAADGYGELDDAKKLASSSSSSAPRKLRTLEFDDGIAVGEGEAANDAQRFALRPEFLGERGKKLFELQKRFGGDQRFRLDARFMEDEENEYADGGAAEEEGEIVAEKELDLQAFQDEADAAELAAHEAEMAAEQDQGLKVLGELFPDLDVERVRQRIEARKHRDPIKEASWMGEMKRYDPRVPSSLEYELSMEDASKNNAERQQEKAVEEEERRLAEEKRAREEKEVVTGGDRFYAASNSLGSLFTRVRKNSEDGEVGEAALDGVFSRGGGGEGGDGGGAFKLSSLFSFSFGGDKKAELESGEALLEEEEGEDDAPRSWGFAPTFGGGGEDDEMGDDGTDKEEEGEDEGEEEEEEATTTTKAKRVRVQRSLEDFLAFGRSFFSPPGERSKEEQAAWAERRKKLTLDFKRKRRDALKLKKKQQQSHKRPRTQR